MWYAGELHYNCIVHKPLITSCIYYRDDPLEELKPLRNKLCDLLDIPKPVPIKVRCLIY